MDAGRSTDRSRDFGGRMKRLREERGVALRDIAEQTKISVSALESLERNDISRLPGGIFRRGFVRAYAAQIGADPERTLREFLARFPDDSVSGGPALFMAAEVDTDPPAQMARRVVMAMAVLVPVAAAIIWSLLLRG